MHGPFLSAPPIGCSATATAVLRPGQLALVLKVLCNAYTQAQGSRQNFLSTHRLAQRLVLCVMQERFPQFAIPDVPEQQYDTAEKIDNSKVEKELGLQLTPPVTTFIDGIVTLVQIGIAQPLPSGAHQEGTPAV